MKSAIIFTGTSGSVGTGILDFFGKQNKQLYSVGRKQPKNNSGEYNFIVADLRDETSSKSVLSSISNKCSKFTIIHLAAYKPNSANISNSLDCYNFNKTIDDNVQKIAEEINAKVIYMSTCGLYDQSDSLWKFAEKSKIQAFEPYFRSKIEGEEKFFSSGKGVIFRLSSPLSNLMDARLVVPKMIRSLIQRGYIEVWGSGRREQDFIDVKDIHTLLKKAEAKSSLNGIFNLASGKPISMKNLAENLIELYGKGYVKNVNQDPNEGSFARYSIVQTKEKFNWHPETSHIDSFKRQLNLHREFSC